MTAGGWPPGGFVFAAVRRVVMLRPAVSQARTAPLPGEATIRVWPAWNVGVCASQECYHGAGGELAPWAAFNSTGFRGEVADGLD